MKPPVIQPYLFFGGCCEEAIEFYQSAIGAEVTRLIRFSESPDPAPPGMVPDGWENKIMHSEVRIGGSTLLLSDGCEAVAGFSGFSLSLAPETEADVDRIFTALADGGRITMALNKTFWSARFGMLEDRFGIGWMVGVAQ